MEKVKVLHRRKRNSKKTVEEVKKLFKILYNYDKDMRGFMFDETVRDIKEKSVRISDLVEGIIYSLADENMENKFDEMLNFVNNCYIDKFGYLNIKLLQDWQDNLPNIVNVEYDTLYTKYSLRRVMSEKMKTEKLKEIFGVIDRELKGMFLIDFENEVLKEKVYTVNEYISLVLNDWLPIWIEENKEDKEVYKWLERQLRKLL